MVCSLTLPCCLGLLLDANLSLGRHLATKFKIHCIERVKRRFTVTTYQHIEYDTADVNVFPYYPPFHVIESRPLQQSRKRGEISFYARLWPLVRLPAKLPTPTSPIESGIGT